jgi:hypothetical protein
MATLSQINKETRLTIKWGIILLVLVILIFSGIKIGGVLKEAFFPTPPAPPTVSFDKLPEVAFPKNDQVYNLSYSIDTLTGKLPEFSDRASVYKMKQERIDLLAFQRAKDKAAGLGFSSAPTALSEGVYQWTDSSSIQRKFTLSILDSEFSLDSNFYTDEKIVSGKNLPSEKEAITMAKNFLSNLSMFPDTLGDAKTKTTLFTIKNYVLIPATSFADSQLIQVNFFQKDIDEKQVFYKSPYTPNITAYITGGDSSQIVKADYFYQETLGDSATYPIKTAKETLEDLQNGKAFFASVPTSTQNISIKDVTLGYFMPNINQEYLLPIVVFTGNDGFFAYVSAVKDEWINK